MEMWAVDNRERLSSAGNLWETVLSRVTKQNQAREEAKKPGQSGISEPLLPLSASLFMTEITSHHTGVWTRHGSYMLEKSGSIHVECMDGRLSTSMIKHPSMAFHNLESWGLDHLLSCTSYFPTTSSLILILLTTSFSLLVLFCCCPFLSSSSSKSILTCDDSFLLNHEPILRAWVKHVLSRSILS